MDIVSEKDEKFTLHFGERGRYEDQETQRRGILVLIFFAQVP